MHSLEDRLQVKRGGRTYRDDVNFGGLNQRLHRVVCSRPSSCSQGSGLRRYGVHDGTDGEALHLANCLRVDRADVPSTDNPDPNHDVFLLVAHSVAQSLLNQMFKATATSRMTPRKNICCATLSPSSTKPLLMMPMTI